MLDKEFKYYLDNQEELARKWNRKFIVLVGEEIVGVYTSKIEAYSESQNKYDLGTFLIQECGVGEENHTMTVHALN